MKALTFAGYRSICYETVDDPSIEAPGDVLVRVGVAGICGSDLHPYHEREQGLDLGTVMGHEFVGEIVEIGADVKSLAVGDTVFSPFTTSCGVCPTCRSGLTSRCPEGQLFGWVGGGWGLEGGQAEYVRVPLAQSTLLPVPEGVSAEQALLIGDIYSTGYFCAEMAGVQPGGVYVVVGCGPVGVLAILAARDLGAEIIYALDTVPERRALAASVGAVPLDPAAEDPVEVLHDATDGRGADAVLEAVGNFSAERAAVEMVRSGGTVAVVGVHNDESFAFSPSEAYDKNLTYKVGRCPARAYMDRLAPRIREHDPGITKVISHRLPLADGPDAYRMFDEKLDGCTKVILAT